MTFIAGLFCFVIIALVMALRISMWLFPTQKNTPNFESKPYTGWSNLNPKKMATYRNIEVQSGNVKASEKDKFKGVG